MKVYLCVMWDSDFCTAKYAICANTSEVKKVYREYLLSIRSEEEWISENWRCDSSDTIDDLVDSWWETDDYFNIIELDVRGT